MLKRSIALQVGYQKSDIKDIFMSIKHFFFFFITIETASGKVLKMSQKFDPSSTYNFMLLSIVK